MPRTEPGRSILSALLPWVTALVVLAAIWVWAGRWLPGGVPMLAPGGVSGPVECQPESGPCRHVTVDGGFIELALSPVPIRALTPSVAGVQVRGGEVVRGSEVPAWIEIDFAGVEMYMGFNRFRLESDVAGGFSGEFLLPVCSRERMTWLATLLPEGDASRPLAQFTFVARR